MKRRTVLKALAGGSIFCPLLGAERSRKAVVGKRGSLKKMVVVFLRGGNDGLNTLVPVDSNEYNLYRNLRPTLGLNQGDLVSLSGNSFFGWHPNMAPLSSIQGFGHLSMVHAVGYPGPDRSHFESQSFYETGIPGNSLSDGWLNRYLHHTSGPGLIRGLAIGSNIPQSVSGQVPVPVSHNFGETSIESDYRLESADQLAYENKMRELNTQIASPGNDSLYDTGGKIFDMIDNFADRDFDTYVPDNSALYPSTSLGRHMSHAAQMLKDTDSFLGVEVVTVETGGYDTHANQHNAGNAATGNHANLLQNLSSSMLAFYTDMGTTRMQDIVVLVVSEFGRVAFQNDSRGTDHGTGSLMMCMSSAATGAVVNGGNDWPGLANLYQNRDLQWVTDFRDVYWEVLSRHMGVDNATLNQIIPGHTYTPVGVMN